MNEQLISNVPTVEQFPSLIERRRTPDEQSEICAFLERRHEKARGRRFTAEPPSAWGQLCETLIHLPARTEEQR